MPLNKTDKEFIEMALKPIQIEIAGIKDHLGKINGKVQKHEQTINEAIIERAKNREHQEGVERILNRLPDKIECLEDQMLENKLTKKYIAKLVASSSVIISVLYTTIEFVKHLIESGVAN